MARSKRMVGDIFKVNLEGGRHSYAHVSTDPVVIFYDCMTSEDLILSNIPDLPVAFKLWVLNSDIKSGIWKRIGNISLSPEQLEIPPMFKQDPISGRLTIHHRKYVKSNYQKPASTSECDGLERAAVWEARHIEDRLRDHFNGTENKWVKSMKLDLDSVPEDQRC